MPLPQKAQHKKLKTMASARARIIIGNLRRENASLLKLLSELARHHNDPCRIIEKFLALLGGAEGTHCVPALEPEEQWGDEENRHHDVNVTRLSFYVQEVKEIKDELVKISAWCQHQEGQTAKERDDSASITALQSSLKDALEKNKQWMDYDQQREAYVKSIVIRLSWLENHLHDVSIAQTAEHNQFLLDENKKIKQVKLYYEGLMEKARTELNILRELVCLLQQALTEAQRTCREELFVVDQLQEQLQCGPPSSQIPPHTTQIPPHTTEDEEAYLTVDAKDLHLSLKKEKRKSATLELQKGHLQKFFLNQHHKAQRQIAKFKRKVKILNQDLHDEKENCSYLKEQLELVQTQTEENEGTEKADGRDQNRAHPSDLPPRRPKPLPPPSPYKSVFDESFLNCPVCNKVYRASQHRELLEHLDYCKN